VKNAIPVLVFLAVVCLGGCAAKNRPNYVWNDYSSSLYAAKKSPGAESLDNHKAVLLSIIEDSKKEGYRVPPGVYCEYGYLLFKEGKGEEATRYFALEEQIYPESRIFISNLKTLVEKTTKKDADEDNDKTPVTGSEKKTEGE